MFLKFLADYLSKEKRRLHRSSAQTHRCLCHDGPAASPHQLCGARITEAGGPAGELPRVRLETKAVRSEEAERFSFSFLLQWLNEEKLVQRLTELIHSGKDEEVRE